MDGHEHSTGTPSTTLADAIRRTVAAEQPAPEPAEVERIVRSVARYTSALDSRPPREPLRLLSMPEVREHVQAQPIGWLVDGVLPRAGVTLLAGAPRAGKTTLAVAASVAVASGGAPLAGHAVEGGPVAYVYQDRAGLRHLHGLVHAAASGLGVRSPDGLPLRVLDPDSRWTLDDEGAATELAGELDRMGAALVVVDSLRSVTSADEDRATAIRPAMQALDRLTGGGRRAVVATHHVPHGARRPRGSTDLSAAVETEIIATRTGDVVTLDARHHRAPEHRVRWRVRHEDDGAVLRLTAAAPDAGAEHAPQVADAVLEVLRDRGRLTQNRILADLREREVRVGNGPMAAVLRTMVEAGQIRCEDGPRKSKLYTLAVGGGD